LGAGHSQSRSRNHNQGGEHPVSEREYSERPWGNYTVLDDDAPDHKVKRLVVHPGKRLSYQRHSQRAEHWFIVAGTATVTLDGKVTQVHAGEAIDIPLESAHRVANEGDTDVVLIEVQRGTYFGEDDIVRLEDDYGRLDAPANTAGNGTGGAGKAPSS
jgi:mannose-6-phosphate isomerase